MPISDKASEHQKEYSVSNYSTEGYQVWPLFMLSFIRLFYVSIFERALQNYLLFVISIRPDTLGFISSAGAIAYIFAPILGQFITSKLGIRNSLILSCVITPILTGTQIIYYEPWFLIICRIILGLSLGVFWPNCFNLLSRWQKVSNIDKSNKNFKHFNFSWNSGFLLGLLVGYTWAFVWNDYFAMIASWGISFLLIPVSFFLTKESRVSSSEQEPHIQVDSTISHIEIKKNHPMIIFPILFSWIGILFLAISKANFLFSYQIFLEAISNDSTPTYLVQFGIQATQLIGLTWINSMKVYKRKISVFISTIFVTSFSSLIIFFNDIWVISILSMSTGLFFGLIHGTSMKIMLEHGTAKNTSKFSTINEILVGIGFGLTPIIAGFVALINIYFMFLFLSLLGLVVLIFLINLSRNVKK
ncbi:MAG: sugar MFS transporter [Candidatus Hermodarchaeota archaeon]